LEPRYKLVRMKARSFHKDLLYPPIPIYDIARSVARVVYTNEPVIKDAACFYLYERKDPCIFVNIFASENRVHYTLAHEVAHIVLDHFEILKKYTQKLGIPINDKLFYWCDVPQAKPLLNVLEREADIFAAELLMPVKWLYKPKNKTDFENLRDSLEVSNQALIYRLDETGIISRNTIKRILNGQPVGARTPW
jgi:Zn-dependent peptidase ImmA (M78 family)